MEEQKDKIIEYEIVLRDPQPVLRKQLGDDLTVVSFDSTSFVKSGDHYGSTILKVHVEIKKSNGETEYLNLVAKMLPPTDYQRSIFESDITFVKEIFIYENLIPIYKSLYKGTFDIAPKFYGARQSMKSDSSVIDDDAVILMENLKSKGYVMEDRHEGLDLAHLKVAVSTLAKFHAIGLSIKYKVPEYLESIKKYVKTLKINEKMTEIFLKGILHDMKNDPEMHKYVKKIEESRNFAKLQDIYYLCLNAEDPWACIVHADYWNNNVLFHRDESGNVDDAKIVDFQTCHISSPLTDLIFFLFSSMKTPLKYFDEMLEYYRKVAIEILEELECDASILSKESFNDRLKIDAAGELLHCIAMTKVVELREGEHLIETPTNEHCLRRLRNILDIYNKKNWI